MVLSFSVNLKKNCRINFQCRRKNVIMVVYGKSDCGPCPGLLDDFNRRKDFWQFFHHKARVHSNSCRNW